MRNIATSLLATLCLLGMVALASAEPNGRASGPGGPVLQDPSNQGVIFHYDPLLGVIVGTPPGTPPVPGGQCYDAFTGGVKMRHAPGSPPTVGGTITIQANVSTAVFAQLYWVILADAPPPATETLNGTPLVRIPIGPVTPSPCWAEAGAFAYRANVAGLLVPGSNVLAGFPDSGVNNTSPETEGASLVAVYSTNGVDKEIVVTAGNDLIASGLGVTTATLPLPGTPGFGAELVFIVGDGQPASDEAYWNGVALDGGDAFLGIDQGPGTGFWDTMEFGVFTGGANTAEVSTLFPTLDCLNWVGTVLKIKRGGCETVPVEPQNWGGVKNIYR